MWTKEIPDYQGGEFEDRINEFKSLLQYVDHLAQHKLGYPVSLLTYLGVIDNRILGILPGSLANVLLNNVGDPFKDSETSLMEVKKHEREIITILEKYYGLKKNEARGYVTTGGTEGNFAGLWWSKRFLISSAIEALIKNDDVIKNLTHEAQQCEFDLAKIPVNDYHSRALQLQKILDLKNAIHDNKNIVQQILTPTVFYTKNHTHYSIPKIAEILRLNIRPVESNSDGSIDLINFKKALLLNKSAFPHSPVIVIANIGTTITGAIDDVLGIKKVLENMPDISYHTIHLDGALTGFVMPILKPFGDIKNYFDDLGVNSLAVSAHKFPGLSQPCGILLARNAFFQKAFEKSERNIDYVGNIVDVTITGSRSGLNVLMFYNALYSLGLHRDTYQLTEMVQKNIDNAKYLYNQLTQLFGPERVYYPYHFNVMFPRPSQSLAKKYQLMLTGERATICVLTNVTRELIDQFIKDLKLDKEQAMKTVIKTDFTIQTLTDEHVKSTTDLFVKAFCDSEPMTQVLSIQYDEYEPFAKEVIQKAVKEGMSKIAIDKQNRVVACTIAEDLSDPFIPKIAHYAKLRPVFALLDELSRSFLHGKKFIKGKVVHVWIAAVDPDYRGQHLSIGVAMACVEAAARKGFDFAYAEFTNDKSENVTHQFNVLKLVNRINYDDFTMGTQKPFNGLSGSASAYIAAIRPGVRLDELERTYTLEERY